MVTKTQPEDRPTPPAGELLEALLAADRERAQSIVEDHLAAGRRLETLVDAVIQPVMAEIGQLWEDHEISVADEHLATATMQTVMARTFTASGTPGNAPGRVLLACVEGNQHALGLRGIADVLEGAGWETRFLGADVPTEALVEQVERWRPDAVCLSVSLPEQLSAARDAVEAIRGWLGDEAPRILVGGRVELGEDVAASTGADTWAGTAEAAVEALA